MKLSLELDFCTQLIWHLFSFVIIQASASIPYWPQNDGSSLELGEFTITKRFYNQVHIKLFSPFKYLLHEIFSCKICFKFLTYWLLLRFSSESGSYTTTTLQLTHGSFTHHHNQFAYDHSSLNCDFRSQQKSEDSVALAIQRMARPWLSWRRKLLSFHILMFELWQNFVKPMKLKVGEYLTFMEELSALRRHTVSEVTKRFPSVLVFAME